MKLLGNTEHEITKDKNGNHGPHFEVQKQYQSIIMLSIMIISKIQESCINFLKTFNPEFQAIKVWFKD